MDLFDKAVIFATNAHSGQLRKCADLPYILHPFEVANIIATMTSDREVMIAGLLHDTIEDCNVTPEEITEKFGQKVLNIVLCETEDKLVDLPPEQTWEARKLASLKFLKETDDLNVKILWLADKLSNVRSFYREFCEKGSEFWNGFHQSDPAKQAWYYRTISEYLFELKETPAYKEYNLLISKIFEGV